MHNQINTNAMMTAILRGDAKTIHRLVGEGFPIDEMLFSDKKSCALFYAADRKKWNSVEAVLEAGANANTAHPDTGQTALHRACEAGELEAVKALLDANADPNFETKANESPLTMAMRAPKSKAEILAALIEADALVQPDENGKTPLHENIESAQMVDVLVDAGADVNGDCRGNTPLMIALENMLRSQRRRGNNPEDPDLSVIEALLAKGADPKMVILGSFAGCDDAAGQTILDFAKARELPEKLVEMLENAKGPQPNGDVRKKK